MRTSAGLVLYRLRNNYLEVFLVHPGGPYWKDREEGAWSIPKGEFSEGEDPLATARREFREETGQEISGDFTELGKVQQKGGKLVLPGRWKVILMPTTSDPTPSARSGPINRANGSPCRKWTRADGFPWRKPK